MLKRPLLLPAAALLVVGTIAASPATAGVPSEQQAVEGQAEAAARYLGTTPELADEFFRRQNADLDALDRLDRLTTETDGAFFKNGEATVNVTSARAGQLGLTPRYAVRGKRALQELGALASKLAGGSASAPDIARQQVVVYLESASATNQLRVGLASLPGVRVEVTSRRDPALSAVRPHLWLLHSDQGSVVDDGLRSTGRQRWSNSERRLRNWTGFRSRA